MSRSSHLATMLLVSLAMFASVSPVAHAQQTTLDVVIDSAALASVLIDHPGDPVVLCDGPDCPGIIGHTEVRDLAATIAGGRLRAHGRVVRAGSEGSLDCSATPRLDGGREVGLIGVQCDVPGAGPFVELILEQFLLTQSLDLLGRIRSGRLSSASPDARLQSLRAQTCVAGIRALGFTPGRADAVTLTLTMACPR